MTQWGNHSWQAFVQMNDHADIVRVSAKIKNISMIHLKEAEDEGENFVAASNG